MPRRSAAAATKALQWVWPPGAVSSGPLATPVRQSTRWFLIHSDSTSRPSRNVARRRPPAVIGAGWSAALAPDPTGRTANSVAAKTNANTGRIDDLSTKDRFGHDRQRGRLPSVSAVTEGERHAVAARLPPSPCPPAGRRGRP